MAAFLIRALLGSEDFTFAQTPFFSDVPATHPLFRYVQKLRELGITAGCSASTYCPEDPVTRSQMALFVVRAKLAVAPSQSFPYPSNFSTRDNEAQLRIRSAAVLEQGPILPLDDNAPAQVEADSFEAPQTATGR